MYFARLRGFYTNIREYARYEPVICGKTGLAIGLQAGFALNKLSVTYRIDNAWAKASCWWAEKRLCTFCGRFASIRAHGNIVSLLTYFT